MDILLEQLLVKSVLHITLFIRDIMSRTVLSGSSFIFVNWKIHVYLPNFQCLQAGLYFQVYRRFLLRLFAGFNMYPLFAFIFQFIFLCTGNVSIHLWFFLLLFAGFNMYRLFVFIFQFIFLCAENFPSICGKINTNRRYILNPANRCKKNAEQVPMGQSHWIYVPLYLIVITGQGGQVRLGYGVREGFYIIRRKLGEET